MIIVEHGVSEPATQSICLPVTYVIDTADNDGIFPDFKVKSPIRTAG